jgi:peptide/nickel transport system substrate-binding protein
LLEPEEEPGAGRSLKGVRIAVCGLLLLATARCGSAEPTKSTAPELILRVGVGQAASGNTVGGLTPFFQNLSSEGLARIADNGRAEPRLAEGWTVAPDGLSMEIRLRPGVTFHDGAAATADAVVQILNSGLPQFMGPAFSDVNHIIAVSEKRIEIGFKRASPFLQEALELQIRQPDRPSIGTGPFQAVGSHALNELRANPQYYLGRPAIDRIVVTNYPSVRAAWADLLRDRIDMLYEVSAEALDSLTGATTVSVSSFTRPYQYVIAFNQRSPTLQSPKVRWALNAAIDRAAFVRDGLLGRGAPSSGPIWPQHWALTPDLPGFDFAPGDAVQVLSAAKSGRGIALRFKCLVPSDQERRALLVKRQLEMVGVEMDIEEVSPDRMFQALSDSSYEAVFLDMVSGPSLFRVYLWWHSAGSFNPGTLGSDSIDGALDRIRYAGSDGEYRTAVADFQRTVVDNPPGIFLAWSERARAVSRRFHVPGEPGRDVLTTLRLWRPADDLEFVGRN